MRKVNDVWTAIEDQRVAAGLEKQKWRHSFEGVQAAMQHIGLVLVNTKEEFDSLEVPHGEYKQLHRRKVTVSRQGVISKPTEIKSLLSGNTNLLTEDERLKNNKNTGRDQSARLPKGTSTLNLGESHAIDELDELLGTSKFLERQHLYEMRLADIAYSEYGSGMWLGDQIKHAVAGKRGSCNFNHDGTLLTVKGMLMYLGAGLTLTCIGKNAQNVVDVVWFFHGEADIEWLSTFGSAQQFTPQLHLKITSFNAFTNAYNSKAHRFDVGASKAECDRLLQRKIRAVQIGVTHTLEHLNEDPSQIPSHNHYVEHQSFAITRAACASINVVVQRLHQDAMSPIDFRVGISRNQDKVFGNVICVRRKGALPYNPDSFDIFQITDISKHHVWALPMRVVRNGLVVSFFSDTVLMTSYIGCGLTWQAAHKEYLFDLKTEEGIQAYVQACCSAANIPQLTDRKWYSDMLAANTDKFGSRKQLAEREPKRDKTSLYIGVSKNKHGWRAAITHNKIVYDLGRRFKTEHDAARARNAKALELLGDDAKLQVILDEQDQASSSSSEYPLDS